MKTQPLRALASRLANTPLHPQWLVKRRLEKDLVLIASYLNGSVLDIGCASQTIRPLLGTGVSYLGLDFPTTALGWYRQKPQVFGDGQYLPLASEHFDWVLLLDVLEHLPNPELCLQEAHRVLKPKGRLILQVPFLYPLHDQPLDFRRWTRHGLKLICERSGFRLIHEVQIGKPIETASLLYNIAVSKMVLDWIQNRNPLGLIAFLLPLTVLTVNLKAAAVSMIAPRDSLMPRGYRLVVEKSEMQIRSSPKHTTTEHSIGMER